jgi:hypothetical protein
LYVLKQDDTATLRRNKLTHISAGMAIVHARVAQNKDKIGAEKTRRLKARRGRSERRLITHRNIWCKELSADEQSTLFLFPLVDRYWLVQNIMQEKQCTTSLGATDRVSDQVSIDAGQALIAGLGGIVTAVWRNSIMAGPGAGHWSLRNGQESATALPLLPCFATSQNLVFISSVMRKTILLQR